MPKKSREDREVAVLSALDRAEKQSQGGGFLSLKLPEGSELYPIGKAGVYNFDILPYKIGEGHKTAPNLFITKAIEATGFHWERTYWVHRQVGGNNTVSCSLKNQGKKCAVCSFINANRNSDNAALKQLAYDMRPSERQLFNVLPRDDEGKLEKKPKVKLLDYSNFLFGKLLNNRIKRDPKKKGFANFIDLKNGFTLVVTMEEKAIKNNKCVEAVSIDFEEREPLDKKLIDMCFDLDAIPRALKYSKVEDMLNPSGDDDDDDEDAGSTPSRASDDDDDEDDDDEPASKKDKGKGKKAKPDDDDDDDDDDDEDSDDDDDTPPAKKGKKGKKPAEADDDDDDDDEDEDEDDDDDDDDDDEPAPKKDKKEAPAKKGKGKKDEDWEDDDDDEDSDDDDDDDDDDEPAPKKDKGKKK